MEGEAIEEITSSCRYAKRQLSWCRRDARTIWIDMDSHNVESACEFILKQVGSFNGSAHFFNPKPKRERAFLVGVEWAWRTPPVDRSLDQLERLASTAGADCFGRITQRLDRPCSALIYRIWRKFEELKGFVDRLDIQVVIFDESTGSPSQQFFILEKKLGPEVKVIDRTALIQIYSGFTQERGRRSRFNSRNFNTCFLACEECGAIYARSRQEVVSALVLDKVRASSKSIGVLFEIRSRAFVAS